MDTKMRATALVTLAIALMGSASIAATVNVDFNVSGSPSGHYTGTGAAPDPGTFWNGLTVAPHNSGMTASLSSGSLLASDGTTDTGFTVTLQNFNTYDAANDGQSAPFAPALLNDFIWVAPTQPPLTFTVSNLLPGGSYDLYLYSQNGGYNNETTGFTVGGVPQIATNGPGDLSGFVQNGNYVLYSSVIADAVASSPVRRTRPGRPTLHLMGSRSSGLWSLSQRHSPCWGWGLCWPCAGAARHRVRHGNSSSAHKVGGYL